MEKWGVVVERLWITEQVAWGFQKAWLIGTYEKRKNPERKATKNYLWALLFCLSLVLMLGVNSCIKPNPGQLKGSLLGLKQIILPHCFHCSKQETFSVSPCILNWPSALVYSKEVAGSFSNRKTWGSHIRPIVISGELVMPEGSKKEKYYIIFRWAKYGQQALEQQFPKCAPCNITPIDAPWKKRVLDQFHWRF